MNDNSLWFVAVIPPEPVLSEIQDFKVVVKKRFNSAHALRSPAHVTLFPPFRAGAKKVELCRRILHEVAGLHRPFIMPLEGFAAFRPQVLYVKPVLVSELKAIQADVESALEGVVDSKKTGKPFKPHITIAFRDLTPDNFHSAWEFFRNKAYARRVPITRIALLQHSPEGWKIDQEFMLSSDITVEMNTVEP